MKLKPISIITEFNVSLMTMINKESIFFTELESYVSEIKNRQHVSTVWSTGVVYQDTVVVLQDKLSDLGTSGACILWDLAQSTLLQVVKVKYVIGDIKMDVFRIEHHLEDKVISAWFVNTCELDQHGDRLVELITAK